MSYKIEIQSSIENGIFSTDEIYSFSETPYEQQFESYYDFCRSNLNIVSEKYSIQPNIFVYYNSFSVNAKAGVKNDHFVIAVNSGLIVWSIQNFLMNENYDQYIKESFPYLLEFYDNTLDVLSFQLSTQFTYYHELGHLIQFSKVDNNELLLNERIDFEGEFNLTSHWLEINADTFASISLASHIQQYLFKQIGDELNIHNATNSLIIFGTSLLGYIMSFSTTTEKIYFFERSHPHPIIRLINILMTVIHYLNQSPKFAKIDITFNFKHIFDSVFKLYSELENQQIVNTKISENLSQALVQIPEIIAYNKAIKEHQTVYNDAIVEWNKNIT